jgi:zinc transport system substrate-binding protein
MRSLILGLVLVTPIPALADGPAVTASHDVLAAMVRAIAPEAVVTNVAPEGTDPATFAPDIPAIAAIQAADLIVLNGAGFDGWASRVSLPRARVIDTSAAIADELIHLQGQSHSHGTGSSHSHDGTAPHVWMDFALAQRQAQAVAAGLTRAAPDAADRHAANLAALDQRLAALDAQATAVGAALTGQTVLVAHSGYEYLGRAYDIALQEATLDPVVPATPDQLDSLDAALAGGALPLMLWNASPPADTATALADRDVAVVVLPDGVQVAPNQDPFEVIAAGLTALAAALPPV